MHDPGAIILGDCHRQGRNMIEIDCVKCPRYGRYRLDKLISMHGPYYCLRQLAAFASWDCPKRQSPSIDDPCGARCLNGPARAWEGAK
jgi:hypothetical protein